MRMCILLFLLLLSNTVTAEFKQFSEWDAIDRKLFLTNVALHYVDYKQTTWMLKQTDPTNTYYVYEEKNPLLGKRPHNDKLIIAKAANILLDYAVVGLIKDPYPEFTKWYLGINCGILSTVVAHNHKIGISVGLAVKF